MRFHVPVCVCVCVLQLENWVEPGRPRNEAERARDLITEHKIFETSPRSGQLGPGESSLVAVQYRPMLPGQHAFPMFLRVADGKRVHLQLSGVTVSHPAPARLAITPKHRVFTFPATPIDLIGQTPVQLYMLRNGAPCACTYKVRHHLPTITRKTLLVQNTHPSRACVGSHAAVL